MSTNYAGTNTLHGQITIPSDGDPAVAESVGVALRALQDDSVYFATEIAKRLNVVDGGTYTMLGTSVTIQGTPNFHWNVDNFFLNTVTFGATGTSEIVSCYSRLRVRGDAHLVGQNTTIGSGGTQDLSVYADATFYANARFEDDVRLGIDLADNVVVDGLLSVTNPATFNDDVSIQGLTVVDSAVLGSGAASNVTVNGQLAVTGSSALGNAGSDSTTVTGSLTVTGDATLGNAASDTTTVTGDLNVNENSVLGTSSADSCTIPASLTVSGPMTLSGALANALTYTGFGRVPARVGNLISASTTVNVASGQIFVIDNGAVTVISMSDTGATNGDHMLFLRTGTGAQCSIIMPNGTTLTVIGSGVQGAAIAVRIGGSWYGIRLA